MPCDLEVDTDRIRCAARWLDRASQLAGEPLRLAREGPEPGDGDFGSPPVRAALGLIATRTEQSLVACDALARHSASLAGRLAGVAGAFDRVEFLCAAGG